MTNVKRGSRRTWVKFFITGWLHGSIRWQLAPDERSVWADLICLAGECSQEGRISDNDDRAYPRDFIANQLNIPPELLDRTIAKCRHEGRIADDDNVIIIVNWGKYQSEYDRQKKYRRKDKLSKEDKIGDIFKLYENEVGTLTPTTSENLKDMSSQYPADWITDAIKESSRQNKRNLAYIEAILKNRKDGGQRGKPKQGTTTTKRGAFKAPTTEEYMARLPVGAELGDGRVKQPDGSFK